MLKPITAVIIASTTRRTRPVTSRNIFAFALGEWRGMYADLIRARTWRERFAAAFGRPV